MPLAHTPIAPLPPTSQEAACAALEALADAKPEAVRIEVSCPLELSMLLRPSDELERLWVEVCGQWESQTRFACSFSYTQRTRPQ